MTVHQLDLALLVGSLVLLVAVAAVRLSVGTGLPSLLLYVALGVALGESGLGIRFDNAETAQVLGYGALVVILAEGGLTTPWRRIRTAVAPAAVLATVGVGVSAALTAVAGHLVVGLHWRQAFVLGAVVSSTDAAAVFSLLRRVRLPARVSGILEAESGFNDAPAVIAVAALSTTTHQNGWLLAATVAYELAAGAGIGLAVGWLGAHLVRRLALPVSGLYPLAVLGLGVVAYASAAVAHASGFLSVYLGALVLGNAGLPHRPATRGFAEGAAWLAQIGLFVMLGLLASPGRLLSAVLPALAVAALLLLVARPVSVALSVSWFRVPVREQLALAAAALRGGVPVVLATVPVVARVPGSARLFDIVFVLVVVLTLVQGTSLPFVVPRMGLGGGDLAREVDVESSPLARLGADLLEIRVPPRSRLVGMEVAELRLPREAAVTLVVRDGAAAVPTPSTVLRGGDELLVVATAATREAAERRLRAASRAGRLAGWRGETGD